MQLPTCKDTSRTAFPMVHLGQGFYEIRNGQTGKMVFGLHCVDPADPFSEGLSGTYIQEEMGAAESLLPEGFIVQVFESPEAAYSYCMAALSQLSIFLKSAA